MNIGKEGGVIVVEPIPEDVPVIETVPEKAPEKEPVPA